MNYNSLLFFVFFVYSNAFSQEQLDYQCDFYDNGIAVSNGASMQVPYSDSGVGYEWDTRKYPKTFFAEEWPWSQDPKYKFRSDDERWMVLDPKTDKEDKWANGKAR